MSESGTKQALGGAGAADGSTNRPLLHRITARAATAAAIAVSLICSHQAVAFEAPRKPNILIILADDLGYVDIGAQGCKDIPTPNIDSLAKGGIRFTNGYVSCPYCSPTRAGLNTGRYQERFGHEFNEGAGNREIFGLPLTETTIADRFKKLGYSTCAVGKWHLGFKPEMRPMKRGYDEFYGTLANTPYLHPMLVDSRIGPDPKRVADDKFYTTDAYGDRVVEFVRAQKDKAFYLYLPFNACHVPPQATEKYLERFKHIENKERRTYAAILAAMDEAIGRVLATLREAKLEERTLIFFLSDNGGPMTKMGPNGSNNGPLKGQKGDTWEGGIRVPFIVQWKGKLPAGKLYEQPVIQLDILPTALAAAGTEVNPDWKLDGVNLLPFLEGKNTGKPHDMLFWRFGPQWAVRQGDWKLVQGYDYDAKDQGPVHEAKVKPPMLCNLAADIGEKTDLAAKEPERVKALQAAWAAWDKQLMKPIWLPMPAKQQETGFIDPD